MNLFEARAKQRKTQWDISKAVSISQSKLSLIERGYIEPSKNEKVAIAHALGMKVDEISWPVKSLS